MTRRAATSPAPPGQAAPPTRATGRIGEPPSTAGMMATNRLSAALRQGGYVIVHRYTGMTRSDTPVALPNSIDDGQRLSAGGREAAEQIGEVYRRLEIPVGQVVSSEYFFVYQTAMARVGASVQLSRDPTSSPYFDDEAALRASLQALRDRTVPLPAAGTNAALWTHQGRFNLAFGIWLPPGETVVFRPDSGDEPRLVAQLPFDQFVALG